MSLATVNQFGFKVFIVLSIVFFLSACQRAKDHEEYISRLARVLDLDKPQIKGIYPRFPEKRILKLQTQTNTISIKSFLGMRDCKLHLVLAERNSLLGRVATPSQRLFNDLKILHTGPECIVKIEDEKLKNQLKTYLLNKRQDLFPSLAHAFFTQDEYRAFWRATPASKTYPDFLPSESTIDDLKLINAKVSKILNEDFVFLDDENSALEQALGRLRHGDAGQLFYELTTHHASLEAANTLIETRLKQKLCLKPTPTQQARYFQNVINKFFIEKIQTKMVALTKRYWQLMPHIDELEGRLLPYADKNLTAWIQYRNSLFKQALDSTKKHARLIQQLYHQCGLESGYQVS